MAEMSLDSRMNRLIGQLEGIRRMIKSNRRTDDVVQQIMAAGQALSRIGVLLLKEELMRTLASGARHEASATVRARGRQIEEGESTEVAVTNSKGTAKSALSKKSGASQKAKTIGMTPMKQADMDSRTAKETEKILEKIFRM